MISNVMDNGKPYLTTSEVAKTFNVRAITIYRWEKQGLIKSYRPNPKGKKFFSREEILKLVKNNSVISNEINLLENSHSLKIGTKAKNLKIIKEKAGCLIPKTLVINTDIFNQLLIDNKISDPLNYDWSKFQISNRYQKAIIERIDQEFDNKPLVIRSSATCEDSPLLSFAGQYSSFLNIRGKDNIIKAIKLCYQSLFSDNAKIYAKINGVRLEYESMAITVQELASVKTAGVLFTADPVNQDDKKMIIEYTDGLGDLIVSGHQKPILKEIKKREINNLQNEFLKKLSKIALKLEEVFGNPQDIEWGWDGKEVYIFQSRNITTLDKQPKIIKYDTNKIKVIGTGTNACRGISNGILKIINNTQDYDKINKGDVVFVNCKTDISIIPRIPFINALIINGGILSHFAVITREFNIPCLAQPIINKKEIEEYENKKIIVDAIKGEILTN